MKRSKVLEVVHVTVKDLYEVGVVDTQTMRKFDALCLPKIKEYMPKQIANLRMKNKAS